MDTTDIEKKSLEAHVELCAERYKFLETKLEALESKMSKLTAGIDELKGMISGITQKRNDQLIGWGIGIIGFLIASVGWLVSHYILK
jgi:chromosome segregation ATPase